MLIIDHSLKVAHFFIVHDKNKADWLYGVLDYANLYWYEHMFCTYLDVAGLKRVCIQYCFKVYHFPMWEDFLLF